MKTEKLIALLIFLTLVFSNPLFAGDIEITISGPDAPVNGSVYTVTGGEAPYAWSIGMSIGGGGIGCGSISADGVVSGVSNCCGKGIVTVTDACGYEAEKIVRMPNGLWVEIFRCANAGFFYACNGQTTNYKAIYGNFRYFHHSSCWVAQTPTCEAAYLAAGGIILGQRTDCQYVPQGGCLGVGSLNFASIEEWRCQ